MGFENGEMVVRVSDLHVGFVTRVEQLEGESRYRVMFQGGESAPLEFGDLLPAESFL